MNNPNGTEDYIAKAAYRRWQEKANRYFEISTRGSTFNRELAAGVTTYLAMVYSVIVIPGMLSTAGFDPESAFVSTCLVAAFGSLVMGLWANLPMAIGCAISLTAFVTYGLVIGAGMSIPVVLGAVFLTGVIFTGITVLGVRQWILNNLPAGIAHGTGIGIGLFLILIASENVGLITKNPHDGLPVVLGEFASIPVLLSIVGLGFILGLEKKKVPGSILVVILGITVLGALFDPSITYHGLMKLPHIGGEHSLIMSMDILGALNSTVLPIVLALVMTSVFDATATIRAVAGQANLIGKDTRIINGAKALSADSASSIFAGVVGGSPAAVYVESAAGTAAGGRTGLTAVTAGLLFFATLFFAPISHLVPIYATAPALIYVGLLMLRNVANMDFSDSVDTFSGLTCAVFIVLTSNIVTGIMLGYMVLVIGRLAAGEYRNLNIGTILVALSLFVFYAGGWAI